MTHPYKCDEGRPLVSLPSTVPSAAKLHRPGLALKLTAGDTSVGGDAAGMAAYMGGEGAVHTVSGAE